MESLLCGDPKQTNPPLWDHFDFSAVASPYFLFTSIVPSDFTD